MSWLDELLLQRGDRNSELSDEIRAHLEQRVEDLVAEGQSREDARAQAHREFGNVTLIEQDSREVWQWPRLERLLADFRYGFRVLAKSPGFTAIVILTLALGIGANTALFSVVNAVLIRSLPFPEPNQLVDIAEHSAVFDFMNLGLSIADIADLNDPKSGASAIAMAAPYQYSSKEITGAGRPERLQTSDVSKQFFDVLGMPPLYGRTFTDDDVQPGNRTVVLSYQLWRERFAGDPAAIGKKVTLDGEPYEIIGVMPSRLREAYGEFKLWTPLHPPASDVTNRGNHMYQVIGRLKPGATVAQAQAQLDTLSSRLAAAYTDDKGWSMNVKSMRENLLGDSRAPLLVLFCAAGFVLLIGCANVSNLFLSRGWSRRREFAIRSAIGATRGALLRQLFIESLLVSLAGGACAFLIALWTTGALRQALPPDMPRLDDVQIDSRAALFALGATLLAAVIAGLAPALLGSRQDITTSIKEAGSGGQGSTSAAGHNFLRRLLVVGEVAMACTLLVGATLAIRNFAHLVGTNLGYRADHIVTLKLDFPEFRFGKDRPPVQFVQQIIERTKGIDGVESIVAGLTFPLGDEITETVFITQDKQNEPSAQHQSARFNSVTPGYFETLGIPVLSGRSFTTADVQGATPVFIVNEAFARKVFGTADAVGKRFATPSETEKPVWTEIVGVVGNERYPRPGTIPDPQMYSPLLQAKHVGEIYLAVRTASDPRAVVPIIEDRIWALDKNQPIGAVKTATELIAETHAAPRSQSILLGIFAGLGFLLALVGVYGVMSYLVSQQTREIAIRVALGAESSTIFQLVVGHGLKLTLAGVAVGLAAAFALTRFMHSLLFGISATDPTTFVAVAAALTAVAIAACLIPARRAMRVDPMTALRSE